MLEAQHNYIPHNYLQSGFQVESYFVHQLVYMAVHTGLMHTYSVLLLVVLYIGII